MTYIDLTPYKDRVKKKKAEVEAESESTDSGGFFSNFAEVGKQVQSTAASKGDIIELLNLLNDKLSNVEEKLYRLERKLEQRG